MKKDNTYLKIKKIEEETKFLSSFCQELSTYVGNLEEKVIELEIQLTKYKELAVDQLETVSIALHELQNEKK